MVDRRVGVRHLRVDSINDAPTVGNAACSGPGRALGWMIADCKPRRSKECARDHTRRDFCPHPPQPPGRLDRVDSAAVDTVRVLAADAVQKVGNGHPGTAMSLAPLAYTLFQRQMRHDPSDVHWLGRDRFVLSCGHSSLTLYIQLYLGGFGLELSDIESLRTWRSQDAGPPGVPPHQGRGDHHRSARPGPGLGRRDGDGVALRARPVRPGRRARHQPVRPLHLRDRLRRRHGGGRDQRGVVAGGHPAARQPHRVLRQQPDLDRGRHQHRAVRGHPGPLRGLRLARAGRRGRRERRRHRGGHRRRPRPSPTSRRSSRCAPSSAIRPRTR